MYAHAYAITEDENRISQAKKMRLLNKKGKNSSKSKVTSWKHLLHQRICFKIHKIRLHFDRYTCIPS